MQVIDSIQNTTRLNLIRALVSECDATALLIDEAVEHPFVSTSGGGQIAGDSLTENVKLLATRLASEVNAAINLLDTYQGRVTKEDPELPEEFVARQSVAQVSSGLNFELGSSSLQRAHGAAQLLSLYCQLKDGSTEGVSRDLLMISNVAWDISGRISEAGAVIDRAISDEKGSLVEIADEAEALATDARLALSA